MVTLAVGTPAAVYVLVTLLAAAVAVAMVAVTVLWLRLFTNICHFYRNLYVRLKCMIYSNI